MTRTIENQTEDRQVNYEVFSDNRRAMIRFMRNVLRDACRDFHLTHEVYVLYAALKGKDVRKTSHQMDGANALAILEDIRERLDMGLDRRPIRAYRRMQYIKKNAGERLDLGPLPSEHEIEWKTIIESAIVRARE